MRGTDTYLIVSDRLRVIVVAQRQDTRAWVTVTDQPPSSPLAMWVT